MSFGHRRSPGSQPAPGAPLAPRSPVGSPAVPPAPPEASPAAPPVATPVPSPSPAPAPVPSAPATAVPADAPAGQSRLVRPYTLTGGRVRSESNDFPIETLVVTTMQGQRQLTNLAHERRRIAELCREPISIAEVAARIGVPLGVARVLVGDMATDGFVDVHRPHTTDRPDLKLLERVLGGIRAL